MAEYGSETRQGSSDENIGFTSTEVVEQQSRENVAHDVQGRTNLVRHLQEKVRSIPPQQRLDLSKNQYGDVGDQLWNANVNALASSISEIADVAKENWRKETTNKLALKASAAQGTAIAINSIAETKKRNPFMAAVLGQTVTSRVAEAQSIENATTALYNKANENMTQLAELPTDDAIEQLASMSEDLVASIDDPEFRQQALNSLMGHMPKLAQAHHKERYALIRNKQIENNRESILNKRIAFEYDKNIQTMPEEKMGLLRSFAKSIYEPNDPTGLQQDPASKREFRTLVHTQAADDLKNGNKTLYDAIRMIPEGHPDALSSLEREAFKEAVGQYDSNRNTMAQQVIAEAKLGILSAQSPEEALAAQQIARQNLEKWGTEGSQSEIDSKNKAVRAAQLEQMLVTNAGQWAQNKVELDRIKTLDNYYELDDLGKAALYGTMDRKEKQYVSNMQIPKFLTQLTGQPLEQSKESGLEVFRTGLQYKDENNDMKTMSPVTFAHLFVRDLADKGGEVPDVLQSFVDMALSGMATGRGDKGNYFTTAQREQFRVLEVLVEGASGIKLNDDDAVHFEIMRQGFNSYDPPETIEARYKNFLNNKNVKDMSTVPRKVRIQKVRSTVNNVMKGNVSDRAFSDLYEDYENILQEVGYDDRIAKKVFTRKVLHHNTIVKGLNVSNGRLLNETLGGEYDLDSLLNILGSVDANTEFGRSISAASAILMTMFGTETDVDQKVLTDSRRLELTNIEFVPGDDSVEFQVVGGGVTRIPIDVLKKVSELTRVEKERAKGLMTIDHLMKASNIAQASNIGGPEILTTGKTVTVLAAQAIYKMAGKQLNRGEDSLQNKIRTWWD